MGIAIPNENLKSALLKDGPADRGNLGEDIIISLFTGAMPAKTDMLAAARYHSDGWQYPDNLLAWMTGPHGSTELLRMEWNDFTFREHLAATKIKFNLSKRSESFDGLADGIAGWFFMMEQDEGTAYASNRLLRWAVVGTVGIAGSGADLIIPDPNILISKKYRGNDVSIKFGITGAIA
jgi:hypothetical protein